MSGRVSAGLFGEIESSSITSDEAAEAARRVLSHPKYGDLSRPPSLFDRAVDWLTELIIDIFRALSSAGPRGLFAWVIVAILASVVVFAAVKLWGVAGPVRVDVDDDEAQIDITENLSAAEWRRRAAQAESGGDWREAIRARHRALVVDLVDRDALTVIAGMTAGEIARQVADAHPGAAVEIDELTDLFKGVYFGSVPAGPADGQLVTALAERVLAGVGGRALSR